MPELISVDSVAIEKVIIHFLDINAPEPGLSNFPTALDDDSEEYLKAHNIKYTRIDEESENVFNLSNRHQIMCKGWDAVCQYGSYGYEDGLLEVAGTICRSDIEGWLTAEDVIGRIEKGGLVQDDLRG